MKVVMTNDPGSLELKEAVKSFLQEKGYDVIDLWHPGMNYVEAGKKAAETICAGDAERGVIFCGSGAGVMMAANKHKGIRAVVCESMQTAEGARIINNANVLCMGANVVNETLASDMADIFLNTEFTQWLDEDAAKRVKSMEAEVREIETANMK